MIDRNMIESLLFSVEEMEGRAHNIWDEATGNMAYGNLSSEMKDKYIKQTYAATRIHHAAMEKLREARALLNET